ncbi:hypothetical protein GH714_029678 [Hevea brasiliensis]|uniref:Uncharacterized protein n=1 Tax=Hevea brasiliensis TaxID=3981 RepID=A0A6A6M4J8_HEVBR|nr:hypothetical protein GH714_029678 [Hevea brasiliensis]
MKQKAVCCYDESDSEEDRGGLGGISLEKLSLGPKKKLLVIAPGLLCHRVRVFSKEKPKNCTPDATYGTIQVIDDKPYKALLNPPNTAIFLHEYKAGEANDNVLGPKGEFRLFLDGLTEADDVPTYVKKNLLGIGQPAIGPSHPDWRYYSKIISFWQGVRKD